jgi:hypothetical protein
MRSEYFSLNVLAQAEYFFFIEILTSVLTIQSSISQLEFLFEVIYHQIISMFPYSDGRCAIFTLKQYKREGMQLHFHISRHIAHLGWETPVFFTLFTLSTYGTVVSNCFLNSYLPSN